MDRFIIREVDSPAARDKAKSMWNNDGGINRHVLDDDDQKN